MSMVNVYQNLRTAGVIQVKPTQPVSPALVAAVVVVVVAYLKPPLAGASPFISTRGHLIVS